MPPASYESQLQSVISLAADGLFDRLVAIRRDIHAHPEVGNREHRTSELIVDTLAAAGLEAVILPMGTGASCDVLPEGATTKPALVGLRADIDALPIRDIKTVPYASTVPGVCHACGHDVHTAILLGVGLVLARLRKEGLLNHGVRLIFQPAEETSPGGAVDAIAGGVLEGVTEVYALHCDPRTDVGQVALKVGPITSAVDRVMVSLNGSGGHTSRPHLTADLIGALGALATTTPLLLSRRVDPRSGVSLVWGRIDAGGAANAIPQHGEIEGTLRALDLNGWLEAQKLINELVVEVVRPFGVEVDIAVTSGLPPVINEPAGVDRFSEAVISMLGPQALTGTEQSLGGEDFSWMLQHVPGALARLGVRTPGLSAFPDIHQPTFDVDERCIPVGVKLLAELAASEPLTRP